MAVVGLLMATKRNFTSCSKKSNSWTQEKSIIFTPYALPFYEEMH